MTGQLYCILDYETYSEAPLKKVGAWEYSAHPSTEVLCVAWRVGTKKTLKSTPTLSWTPTAPTHSISGLLSALENKDIVLVAHNALFEQVITRNVLARTLHTQAHYLANIPSSRWVCTASLAAALALPRNLEGAGSVMKLPVQKDMVGHRLMMKLAKPRKPTKNNPSLRHDDPEELARLVAYCVQDIDTEVELFLRVPPLIETERKVWLLDQAINLRGFYVDRPLVKTVLNMVAEETKYLNREIKKLTGGQLDSANQRDRILECLESEGVFLPNLQKKTIEDVISDGLVKGKAKRILEIRQATSKTSTAKYHAFERCSRFDSRLRDILLYHAASTGRWGGKLVQPQNLKRSSLKPADIEYIIDILNEKRVLNVSNLEWLRTFYGDPMSIFSSLLRSVIVAPKGKTLDTADYAAIEARVLFWVARHEDGLKAFREGRDLYVEQASEVYGVAPAKVDSDKRFVGKSLILGAGYGLGHKKFAAFCKTNGKDIGEDLAKIAINAYRSSHKPVAKLWSMLEKAAMAAVQNPGKKYTINRTSWSVSKDFLWCELPSGRKLAYSEPSVQYDKTPWGDKRPVLYYWGIDSHTKKWARQKSWGGVLTENVVQAIARDIMADAMLRIEAAGPWQIVLSVHDELVAERNITPKHKKSSLEEFIKLMSTVPDWAEGLPIKVEGWSGTRYRKG